MTENSTVLEIHDLSKTYRSGARDLTVLRGVEFAMRGGETCAVAGPSGSGKTTLLGLCAGLDRASGGSISLCGERLDGLSEDGRARLRNRSVGFVFQNFQLVPSLTALENVMVPAEMAGGRAGLAKEARSLLDVVGLGDRVDHYPVQLSGGEQQRVALARAFINRPRILFADEPTGNLDEETSALVTGMMFDLNRETGAAVMIVTHDWDLARRTGRILRLRGGEVVEDRRLTEADRPSGTETGNTESRAG